MKRKHFFRILKLITLGSLVMLFSGFGKNVFKEKNFLTKSFIEDAHADTTGVEGGCSGGCYTIESGVEGVESVCGYAEGCAESCPCA